MPSAARKVPKLTDEDIRMDYLVKSGFPGAEARRWIAENPKPTTFGEAAAILSQRMTEVSDAIFSSPEWKRMPRAKKFWYRLRMRIGNRFKESPIKHYWLGFAVGASTVFIAAVMAATGGTL